MKTLKIACTALILLAGISAAACSEDRQTEAADRVEIDGLDDALNFPYDPEEEIRFSISSNKTWSIAKSGLDWLTISQMNGGSKLPATVTLTAAPNDDLERSGVLTVYSGAFERTVTVTQEAFPIVPTLTLDGLTDNTLEFEFSDTEPAQFTLYANVAWTADKQNLDWAEVSPLSGERKKEVTVTVTPTANEDEAREGTITFRAEDVEPVVVTVRQTAFRDDPLLTVTGLDESNTIEFPEAPESPVTLQILSNRSWKVIREGLDWLTVTPESGTPGSEPIDITLSAPTNDGNARSGKLIIRADDSALEDVVITVSQQAKSVVPLAWWTLSDEALKRYSGDKWIDGGKMVADKPAGTTAFGQWYKVNQTPDYTTSFIISGDGQGHYAVKQVWTDDCLEFTVPVKDFAAGSAVGIRFAMSGVNSAPRYWAVEYFDRGAWKLTSSQEYVYSNDGSSVVATYEMTKANDVVDVHETARFTEAAADGTLRFRIRCASGACRIDGKAPLAKPGSSATIRIRQWSTGDNDAISFFPAD